MTYYVGIALISAATFLLQLAIALQHPSVFRLSYSAFASEA
jgi:hypothetical protein